MAKKEIVKNNVVLDNLDVIYVNVNDIKPNAYNPNRQSEHEFELLCRSIEEDGFTTPAVVRKQDMVIVDGEHRWRAAQSVGMLEIPVVLVEMTDEQMKIATLRHNRARGEEDAELAAAVLRDLAKMGALDEAQDSLMLDDVEMKKLLDEIGIGGNRLEMYFVSGGMGETFASAAEEMTERIRELGPNPLRTRV